MSFTNPDYLDERTGNYFVDHWRGNLSLPVSYWINGSLVVAVVSGLIFALSVQFNQSSSSLRIVSVAAIVLLILGFGVWIWAIVGIWRSASKHESRGGNSGWARVAQGMVVLGALNYSGQLAKAVPQLAEFGQLAAGRDPIGSSATLTIEGDALRLTGFISAGTADRFRTVLSDHPEVRRVLLMSPGGRIREATQIAGTIAARHMDTIAVGDCSSSCTIVFLAGAHRFAEVGSSLGFHSPSATSMTDSEAQTANPEMRNAYTNAGLPDWFVDRAMATSSSSIWRPTETQLVELGVINSFTPDRVARNNEVVANGINTNGPKRMDGITVLTGAKAQGSQITYMHKLDVQIPTMSKSAIERVGKGIESTACASIVDRLLIESGGSYVYEYRTPDGELVGRYKLDKCPAQAGLRGVSS
ncbi:hypothetical protein [Novosphingobium olei]|uniref:COG3904 family protein n=1 Tax=Novosphingobium olei TaxID=2728851 RepID=UPI00308E95BF|nr:hypothetical protein NSDW_10650 [Novosphingobium olei]